MLWGGLLMLVAIFISLGFLSRPAQEWAAVLGGIGFGAFVDELGKYLTNHNNYFFQPTIALIYITFILIYFAIRGVFNYRHLVRQENLANAFEIMKQGNINGLNTEDEQIVLKLIGQCDPINPLSCHLKEMLPYIRIVPSRRPNTMNRLKHRIGCLLLECCHALVVCRGYYCVLCFCRHHRVVCCYHRHHFALD